MRVLAGAPAVAPDTAMRARLRRFSGWLWVSSLVAIFSWSQIELVYLERLGTAAQVGYFAVAVRVTGLATRVPLMLGGAFLPHFAERLGADDRETVRAGYAAGTRLTALVLFPLSLGLAATAPLVVPLLYGPEFGPAVPVAVVLALSSCLVFASVGGSLIFGADRSHVRVRWAIVAAVLMVVLLPRFVPEHGAIGAAWVRVGVRSLVVLIASTYIARCLGMPVPVRSLLRILGAAGMCGLAAWGVVHLWPEPVALLVAVPTGGLVYLGGLRLCGAVHPQDAAAYHRFFARAPGTFRRPLHALARIVGGR